MSFRGGTLLYTGDLGYPEDSRIEATVRGFTLTVHRDFMTGQTSGLVYQLPPEYTASFELENVTINKGAPPETRALQELTRRHPHEYAELLEAEQVIQALGG